ncbi:NFX1-type zinc finger-containing protein 1 [Brienomyrus brachyistius]|uniref:NFX1-type zinc finger-containing protein 1 n=1 Tax=Brienomyrus brachyistius TaxID=42636 RepID=UPI0020B298C3|nr:NFX1-type zinc finger-containing protein 1 [Brienomyrus brachyistius]
MNRPGGQRGIARANVEHQEGAGAAVREDNWRLPQGQGGRGRARGDVRGRNFRGQQNDRRDGNWRNRGDLGGLNLRGQQDDRRDDNWRNRGNREENPRRGRGNGAWERGRGGRRGGGQMRGDAPEVRKLGLRNLEELSKKEASEMAITLSSSQGLQVLLEEMEMGHNLVQLLCQVLSHALSSKIDRQIVQHLAGVIKDSMFLRTILPHYVAGMMTDHMPARRMQYPQHLDNIISLLSHVIRIFPASSVPVVSMLVTLLRQTINELRASGVTIQEDTEQNLEKIHNLVNHLTEKKRDGTLRSDNYTFLTAEESPPGVADFRTMPIYPTPEEIHQNEKPFLRPNITSQAYASSEIYLDTHFRLLREDFVRPLREGIKQLLEFYQEQDQGQVHMRGRRFNDIRIYFDTRLVVPLCTPSGIAYKVQFDASPLTFVRWQNSKRLLYGSLVCLSHDNFETLLFATVSDRVPEDLQKGLVQLSFSQDSRMVLAEVQVSASFLMVETTAYFEAYRHVLEGLQEEDADHLPFHRYIVECKSEIQPPAYLTMEKTLDLGCIAVQGFQKNLKPFRALEPSAWPDMEQLGLDESQMNALKLALTKEVAIIQGPPGTGKTYVGLKIAQALLKNSDMWSDLVTTPVLVVCYTNHALDQFLEGIHGFLQNGIVRVGGRSSSEVLKHFTLRELTGAAEFRRNLPIHLRRAYYEISMELAQAEQRIQEQASQLECSLRGILHEQYLERFISEDHWNSLNVNPMWDGFQISGKKQSVILGWLGLGSSAFQQTTQQILDNAEEEEEEPHQDEEEELVDVEEEADLIQAERILEGTDFHDRGTAKRKKKEDLAMVELARQMLALNLENIEQEPGQMQGDWQVPRIQKKKMKQRIRRELAKGTIMNEEDEARIHNMWALNLQERWKLYRLWLMRYRTDMRARALQSEQAYQEAAERLAEIQLRRDLCVLREAKVIGMTTTGAAKYRRILQEVRPRLVIVEEAAEVLEAHIITTLSQACQHLILIGDHQQLRPSATVYELAKNFNLEVSLFERLVKLDFPYVRLNYQHRMRPEIAQLLTPHIYSRLENHPSVLEYDNIKGILSNLFFVEHELPEEEIIDGHSHRNRHEALFVVALCRYLLCQDYQPSQITILTTYTGQLHCLRKLLPAAQFAGVKVHVVDKYQGEENDIILLSLVRSNPEGRVGFLQIANRVCVALSRAKKGLYCIGNLGMLGRVQLWSNILHTLREHGRAGRHLMLCCQNHPGTRTPVSCANDFKKVPEGGCQKPCDFRLACGHVCTRACHPYDADHKKFQCLKPCTKVLCQMGHRCPAFCFQDCPECPVLLEKVIPTCQHKQMVPCYQDPQQFICQEPCKQTLECGHSCDMVCGMLCTTRCMVNVNMELQCGHHQKVPCYYISSEVKRQPNCHKKCSEILKCGHSCSGTCHKCNQGRYHKACDFHCGRPLICSHMCQEPCVSECPPCQHLCENRCVHSACPKACGQPCAPCKEPCAWQCPHQRCTKLCHEPCDRTPCFRICTKMLPCGHPCIGLCGETCPNKCRACHHEELTEIFFGTEDDPLARFIQLEDCRHIFESSALDKFMKEGTNDDNAGDRNQQAIRLKECPRCRTPIRRNLRYGAHVNRSLAEIEKVKAVLNGSPEDIERQRNVLLKSLQTMDVLLLYNPHKYDLVMKQLKQNDLTLQILWRIENKMNFLDRLTKLTRIMKKNMSREYREYFSSRIQECLEWLWDPSQKFSEQQFSDLQSEVQRLTFLAELNVCCSRAGDKAKNTDVTVEEQVLRKLLEGTKPFTQTEEMRAKQELDGLKEKLSCNELNITEEERVMIVEAIGLPKGHWYKCPKGHVYAIGDCGGAMQESKCPECSSTIGGTNHALASGNQVASEMDGAQYSAWSEAANLLNFDLRL